MKTSLLEVFFPQFCLGCGYVGTYICPTCESKMKKVKTPNCFYCEKPSFLGLTHPGCQRKEGIDGHFSIYQYDGLFKKLLQASKYRGAYSVLHSLLNIPQPNVFQELYKWNTLFKPFVISVPLHAQRMRERGFNQSEMITKRYFNNPEFLKANLLSRTTNTDHLANIGNIRKRRQHIRGAFTYTGAAIPKAALLVDDVITSGSTILECSKTLKERGVQIVLAFSLAKG